MAPKTELNNPSGSEKNKKTPLWKRVAAGGAAIASLNMLAACGDDEVNAQPEPTEPVATSTLTPGNTNNTPEATPTPSQNETTIPPATETSKPTAPVESETPTKSPEIGEDMVLSPDGEVLTTDEWYEKHDAVIDSFREMPFLEFVSLPEEERDQFFKYTVTYVLMTAGEGNPTLDNEKNPGLYKYSPLEASENDTPEEAFKRYLFSKQVGFRTVSGAAAFNVEDAQKIAPAIHLYSRVNANGHPEIDSENGESIASWSERENFVGQAKQIQNGFRGNSWGEVISESFKPADESSRFKSESGVYTYTDETGEVVILPAVVYAYEAIEDDSSSHEGSVTLVLSNGLWKLADKGISNNFSPL